MRGGDFFFFDFCNAVKTPPGPCSYAHTCSSASSTRTKRRPRPTAWYLGATSYVCKVDGLRPHLHEYFNYMLCVDKATGTVPGHMLAYEFASLSERTLLGHVTSLSLDTADFVKAPHGMLGWQHRNDSLLAARYINLTSPISWEGLTNQLQTAIGETILSSYHVPTMVPTISLVMIIINLLPEDRTRLYPPHAGSPASRKGITKSTRVTATENRINISSQWLWLCEYIGHLHYRWVKKIGRTRASAARGCANAAPAAMPPPTEAREGCSGIVGDACARQLDGGVDGRRPPYRRR